MLLLELLPLGRGNLVQFLADGLVLLILRPHLQSFIQNSQPALRLYNFAAQIIIAAVHGGNLFVKFRHGRNTVCLQEIEKSNIFFEGLDLGILGSQGGVLSLLEMPFCSIWLAFSPMWMVGILSKLGVPPNLLAANVLL